MEHIAKQILKELGSQVPMESFNDDDWYLYVEETGELLNHYSGKTWSVPPAIEQAGEKWAKGMQAKYMMLWRE